MAYQANPQSAMLAFHTVADLFLSSSTADLAPCLCPGNAVKDGPKP